MKTTSIVIETLNKVLKNELTIINQSFMHARIFRHWGYEELNEHRYKHSIRAMKEADALMLRIFFLEGLPNLQSMGVLSIGQEPKECLLMDLELEQSAHRTTLLQAIKVCEEQEDFVSRELLEGLLEKSEEVIDWLETQLNIIEDIGVERFLQTTIETD